LWAYSINSSARASNGRGIVRPSGSLLAGFGMAAPRRLAAGFICGAKGHACFAPESGHQ
jgi:hypothetical protein